MTLLFNDYYLNIAVMTCLWAALSGSWSLMAGYGGLVSLRQSAFFGVGAYATAIATIKFGLSPWTGLAAGVAIAVAFEAVAFWPCFRPRGAFFRLRRWSFPSRWRSSPDNWTDLTRGSSSIAIPFHPGMQNFMFKSRWS